ncbi:hypothetical protein TNCV_2976281 [Trichonephila clavipes]|nr:hypothetical protein TNCV_2976281 [Trichonephila clavipes]
MIKLPDHTLAEFLINESIEWNFIPPRSLNHGGYGKQGTLVLIKDENLPSTKWSTGRITGIFPGTDVSPIQRSSQAKFYVSPAPPHFLGLFSCRLPTLFTIHSEQKRSLAVTRHPSYFRSFHSKKKRTDEGRKGTGSPVSPFPSRPAHMILCRRLYPSPDGESTDA